MIRRPPRSTLDRSSAASDVYKRQIYVVEESDNLITSFLLNGNKINSFIKDVSTNSANGLEGIAFDNLRNLFVTNEKLPKYLIKLKNQVELGSYEINAVEDLSDICYCLLYTSDAADERSSVNLGGRRIIKKKKRKKK